MKLINRKRLSNKLESLIRKLDDKAISKEDIEKYTKQIYKIVDSMKPKYLYKYKSCSERAFEDIKNDRLFMNVVSKFNDPTESMAYINTDTLVGLALAIGSEGRSLNDIDCEDELVQRTQLMNDGLEYIKACRDKVKIVCLSELYDSTLMWSHYANSHKGFLVRYRVSDFTMAHCNECYKKEICWRPGNMIFPVIYKNYRYDATKMAFANAICANTDFLDQIGCDEDFIPIPLLTLLQKEEAWKYEREWRVICKNMKNDYVHIAPDGLFLGDQIECDNAIKLKRISIEKGIPLYKMQIDYFSRSFALGVEEWTDYSEEEIKDHYI